MKKGFVQTLILIVIILGVLVLAGSYFGLREYKNYKNSLAEKEKTAQAIVEAQQKALEDAKLEIDKLKEQNAETTKNQQVLANKIQSAVKPQTQTQSISATELAPYLGGVMQISCGDVSGSISLWKFSSGGKTEYDGLTNMHVIESANSHCVLLPGTDSFSGTNAQDKIMASVDPRYNYQWNNFTDVAVLHIEGAFKIPDNCDNSCTNEDVSISKLNYSISTLPNCSSKMPVGSPVVAIGFPAFGMQENIYGNYSAMASHRIVSNGIISGYNNQDTAGNTLPNNNYYVSAKIDSGNSGGIALSKNKDNKLCVLGIPTWVSLGKYETQGLVQNIHNVIQE